MQWMPQEGQNSRLTAVLLLLVAALLIYLLFFHWFIMRHLEFADELGGLKEQLGRFESIVAQRESLQQQLASIREQRDDAAQFIDEPDFNEAAAQMSDRLGTIVDGIGDEDCQIVSRQPVRPRVEERFQRVTVNVRMRCRGEEVLEILYQMETAEPAVLVEDLNVIRPRARRRTNNEPDTGDAVLDVRFNISSYIRG